MFLRYTQDGEERYMRKIEAIKKELYERIRAQVTDRIGLQDREIKKTEKSFKRFFSNAWKKTSVLQLEKQKQIFVLGTL